MFLQFLLVAGAGALIGVGVFFLFGFLKRRSFIDSINLGLFLIKVPEESYLGSEPQGKEKDFRIAINKFEQLLSNLNALKKTFVFEAAVPHVGNEIHFYLAVPKLMSEVAAKQIQGLWNGAVVEPVLGDYNIFNPEGAAAAATVLQKNDPVLPIRTYRELEADSFASVAGGFSKVNEIGEGAAIQVLIRGESSIFKRRVNEMIEKLRRGDTWESLFGSSFSMRMVGDALNPKTAEK